MSFFFFSFISLSHTDVCSVAEYKWTVKKNFIFKWQIVIESITQVVWLL